MTYESNGSVYFTKSEISRLTVYSASRFDSWNELGQKYLERCHDNKLRVNGTKFYQDLKIKGKKTLLQETAFSELDTYFNPVILESIPETRKEKVVVRITSSRPEDEVYTDKNVVVLKGRRKNSQEAEHVYNDTKQSQKDIIDSCAKLINEGTNQNGMREILFSRDEFKYLTNSTEEQMMFLGSASRSIESQEYFDPIEAMKCMTKGDESIFPEQYKHHARVSLVDAIWRERKKEFFN